jgi:hypothetical protein
MRLPRDLSGEELIRKLRRLGYEQTRQTGSHVRLTFDVCRRRGRTSHHHSLAQPATRRNTEQHSQ